MIHRPLNYKEVGDFAEYMDRDIPVSDNDPFRDLFSSTSFVLNNNCYFACNILYFVFSFIYAVKTKQGVN